MAEYIEREALVRLFEERYDSANFQVLTRNATKAKAIHQGIATGVNWGRNTIMEAPAADVVEVVHGHWNIRCDSHHDTWTGETDEEFYLECSECKRKVWDVNQMAAMNGDYLKLIADFPYCHCGAIMVSGGD